ncbi:hypothetical protein ABIF44_000432 [Bradyrhizobium japonicum]
MRKQIVALEHDADVLAQRAQIDISAVDAVSAHDDLAAVDLLEAVDAAQCRALAGAGAADQRQHFAALDGKGDAIEHPERTKALLHVAERHDRFGGGGVLLHVRLVRGWTCHAPSAVPASD